MEFAELIKTPKVDQVILHRPLKQPTEVVLCITSHHLILSSRNAKHDELWILHNSIDSIEKKTNYISSALVVRCKNLLVIQLDIKEIDDLNGVTDSIEWLSNLEDQRLHYPFFYRPNFDIIEDGWHAFNLDSEYRKLLKSDWRISYVNKDFAICPSYPETILVPKSIPDDSLRKIANFRCLGRLPVLSYLHKPNSAVIIRSAQPLVGPNNRRCKDDERLINAVIGDKRGYIIETRSVNVAQAAKAKGGGLEPEGHYPLLRRIHRPIDRYNLFTESFQKIVEACQDKNSTTERWLSRLEASNWLRHIKDVLTCACLVAQCVDHEGASVLVHGSDGMDTTLQVCSLAQVILDPDCRTVQGFEALIEREWLKAGHPFATRCRYSAYNPGNIDRREHSPVFLLFLDCVFQIYNQFQCSFEFNEDFLLVLFDNAYASRFGTFLANNCKERQKLDLEKKTTSLWSYLNRPEILDKYLNPVYEPKNQAIWPSVAPQSLELWESVLFRWTVDTSSKDVAKSRLGLVKEQQKIYKSEIECSQKRIATIRI